MIFHLKKINFQVFKINKMNEKDFLKNSKMITIKMLTWCKVALNENVVEVKN